MLRQRTFCVCIWGFLVCLGVFARLVFLQKQSIAGSGGPWRPRAAAGRVEVLHPNGNQWECLNVFSGTWGGGRLRKQHLAAIPPLSKEKMMQQGQCCPGDLCSGWARGPGDQSK